MADLLEYKCPSCGGTVAFDSTSQRIQCPFCSASFETEAFSLNETDSGTQIPSGGKFDIHPGEEWRPGEQDGMYVYICRSCGGEIIGDANMAASSCPYCASNIVVKDQFSGDLRPDYIIPFRLDKKTAVEALSKHVSSRRFVPRIFKNKNHIEEIKGIYVPFWLFDAEAKAGFTYHASAASFYQDSSYDYTKTKHYKVVREGIVEFSGIPADGSTKMPDDLMESIEPYDYNEIYNFQPAYLAGYLADRYDITAEQNVGRANERIKKSTSDLFAGTVSSYDTVSVKSSSVRLLNGKAKYALLPVWMLKTKWNNETYTFAMNGQTGKFVGDLPLDPKEVRRYFALSSLLYTAGAFALQWLMVRFLI